MSGKLIPVKVAVRCRPLVPKEENEGCTSCVSFVPGEPQLLLGSNKAFTYDYVFGPTRPQKDVYDEAVRSLVDSLFKGYNATVLAYGQTGSGKTYSMGGGYDLEDTANNELRGVIPRVIMDLFEGFKEKTDSMFTTKVSYIELYKEDLVDLLVPPSKRDKDAIQVREDVNGGIKIVGMKEVEVTNAEEMINCLEEGAAGRTTGSTAMNATSSRSHAIFTIHVEKTSKIDSRDFVKTKFHLVDLAGSERQKKTKAEGERLKEGININKGLLALGNVISALGEQTAQRPHIPYRDSKLTRILQDSLGGNSHTLMIACISPADSNMEETMSTLRYADRARKIKNKPVINRDPQAAEIMRLRQLVQQLQEEVKKGGGLKSLNSSSASTTESENVDDLLDKIKKLQDENTLLSLKLRMVVDQNANLHQKLLQTEESRDKLKETLDEIKDKNSLHISMLQRSIQCDGDGSLSVTVDDQKKILEEIQTTINEVESEMSPLQEENEDEEHQDDNSIFYEEQRVQTMKQVKNMEELGELERQIKSKEIVIKQIMQGDALMKQYEEERQKFEEEINKLQKERTDLMEKVHEAKSNPAAAKISEQRRKRLQEVEAELGKVKRKLIEQAKMLKIKEQDEKRYQKINSEIKELKQARVRMIKQIKEDAKAFAKWKQVKEKELIQLKAKDRKQQIQMVKIKQQSERQQAVLKRKAQEAEAANKRLKEAMAKQKSVMEERMNKLDKTKKPFKDSVKKWIIGDLELAVSLEEARHHMNELIQDRKDLSEQLTSLRERLGTPTFKKKKLNNHSSVETCDHEFIAKDLKEVERQLELRNAQIADIQQKLMDADQDEKTKTRWHGIHTLGEAKVVMNQLFSNAVESKLEKILKKNEVKEANQRVLDAQKSVEEAQEEAQKQVNELRGEIDSLAKHYNKKILALLSELNAQTPKSPGRVDAALKSRLEFQEKEIERLSNLAEELDKKSNECQELQKELTVMKYSVKTGKIAPHLASTSFFTPPQIPKRRSLKRKSSPQEDLLLSEEDDDDDDEQEVENIDTSNDPDWKSGFTPNPSKMMKKKASVSHGVSDNLKNSSKLNESRAGCSCKGSCGSRRCRCVSGSRQCNEFCKCSDQKCQNQEAQMPESTTSEANESNEGQSSVGANTTFILDSSEATVANSTFTAEPTDSKDKKTKPSILALRSVFNDDNLDLDSSEDFETKPNESKNNRTLERSGILSYQKKLSHKKGTFFGKL